MRKILGITLIILGVCVSLYFGAWVMFVGGIAGLIDIVRADNVEGMIVARNIAKIIFASATTSIGVYSSVFIGVWIAYEDIDWRWFI